MANDQGHHDHGYLEKPVSKKKHYEVRVYRRYEEEYVDLEIAATSEEEAKEFAEKEAVANKSLYFGDTPDPSFDAEVNE